MTDNEAMKLVIRGQTGCLGLLFERHRGSLFGSFMRRTGDPTLSEDLVQDTFFRVFKYRETFRVGQEFLPWLHRIARNVLFTALKKNIRRADFLPDDDRLLSEVECDRPAPDHLTEQASERDRLYQALEQLPEEQRQLIILRRIENRTYEEIARLLHCDEAPLKVRVHRAFLKLQQVVLKMNPELKI